MGAARGRAAPRPTFGPIVIGGTKWPSMTSTWITDAPASRTCGPARAAARSRRPGSRGDPARHTRAASSRRSGCRSSSQCWSCARSSNAPRSSGTPNAARSGAGSSRSGSGPGGSSGRSHGSLQTGRRARGQPRIPRQYRSRRFRPCAARSRTACSRRQALLGRRDRADASTRARRRGAARAARRLEHRVLLARPGARSRGRHRASAGRGATRSVPSPLHGGSSSTRSKSAGVSNASASPSSTRTLERAHPLRRPRAAPGPAGMALDGDDLALVAHQRGDVGGLAARRRAQVEDALARLRLERRRDEHRRARLGLKAPAAYPGGERVERPVDDDRVAVAGTGDVRQVESTSGFTRSASSAGALSAASSARVSSAPSASHHSSHEPPGCEWRIAAPRASRPTGSCAPSRWHAPQHRVDETVAGARLGELDRLGDRGVLGDAVEEQQLEEPELQRGGTPGRARPSTRASMTWSSVSRRWTVPNASCLASARSRGSGRAPRRAAPGRRMRPPPAPGAPRRTRRAGRG